LIHLTAAPLKEVAVKFKDVAVDLGTTESVPQVSKRRNKSEGSNWKPIIPSNAQVWPATQVRCWINGAGPMKLMPPTSIRKFSAVLQSYNTEGAGEAAE
jgi:hypothetical protein